jgi:NTP pyrophosphatase (non-canonical NTP hydrolase)
MFPASEEHMQLNEYQERASDTAVYPRHEFPVYPALGLAGEAGECSEKVKKALRDGHFDVDAMKRELGDVLWYVAMFARDCGFTLEEVAQANVAKLADRKTRGVLGGSGDNR